mmetsp:Transcript_15284/g.51392  ORF Transcript_15284/g.51392 Transcript_15284/m.51392 type:complete len:436 (-) Transcript_15284:481-1788(-)
MHHLGSRRELRLPIVVVHLWASEEVVVVADLASQRVALRDPVQLAARVAGRLADGAEHLDDCAGCVALERVAKDGTAVAQPDPLPGRQPEKVVRVRGLEVVRVEVHRPRQRQRPRASREVRGHVRRRVLPFKVLLVAGQDADQRLLDGHDSGGERFQVEADEVLEARIVDEILVARDPDVAAEVVDRFARVAAAPQARNRRHARVVPASDSFGDDELRQLALGEDGVGDVEPRHFKDLWPIEVEGVQHPVVRLAPRFKLQSTNRVVDVLERVDDAVRKVVRRVHAPQVADVRVPDVLDAVRDLVEHVVVGGLDVHLHAERALSFFAKASAHATKESQVLFQRPVAEGRLVRLILVQLGLLHQLRVHRAAAGLGGLERSSGLGNVAARLNRRRVLVAHVRLAFMHEFEGECVEDVKVLRGVRRLRRLPAHPLDVAP